MYNLNTAAQNALNNYINFNDKNLHGIPYFYAFFKPDGDTACHCEWDFGDATGRYLDSVLLCGKVTGYDVSSAMEQYYEAVKWFISLGENGLCYRPKNEFSDYCVNTFDLRSAMIGLITYYNTTKKNEALDIFEAMIKGIKSIGVFYDDYFYMPYAYYKNEFIIENRQYEKTNCISDPCHYGGGVHIHPIMMYYNIVKDVSLLDFAGKIVNFIVKYSDVYADDGSFFVSGYFVGEDGHFHSRMATVTGILEYAKVTGRSDLVLWCRKVYDFALLQGTRFGFFPEGLGRKPLHNLPEEYPETARHTEICCTTDMIESALLLCDFGYGLYGDAERFANQLIKSQFNDMEDPSPCEKADTESISYKDVFRRYKGAFLGRTQINDLKNNGNYDNMGCCASAGGRAVYVLWENAVVKKKDEIICNLWFDMENEYAQTELNEKSEKTIFTIKTKEDADIKIRIPDYLNGEEFICNQDYQIKDGYIHIKNNRIAAVTFKNSIKKENVTLCGENYTVSWKGNKVIDIDRKGEIPLYL